MPDTLDEIDYAEDLDDLEVFANSSITATGEMYRKLVQTAPLGVADGPTRMTYEHLRYLNAFSTYKTVPMLQQVVFELLADSCNLMVSGRMPQEVFTFLASSRALIFAKKGTTDGRAIQCQSTEKKVCYKLQYQAARMATGESFQGLQYGMLRDGCRIANGSSCSG